MWREVVWAGAVITSPTRVSAGRRSRSLKQRHDVVLIPIDDPADREMPAMGPVIFSNAAGELLEVDTDDEAGRRAFRADWEERREELQKLSFRLKLGLIPISTNEDVHKTLIGGLRQYAGRR